MKKITVSIVVSLLLGCLIRPTWAISIDITANLTGEVYEDPYDPGWISTRNILSAYSRGDGVNVYGYISFNLSMIPDNAFFTDVSMTTYHYFNEVSTIHSPHNDPTVNILYYSDDSWTRGGQTDLSLLGSALGTGSSFPDGDKESFFWLLNNTTHDWSTDLIDDTLTLALDVVEQDYRFVYFYGSGTTDSSIHAYDPAGTYAPVLHIDYETAAHPVSEPITILLLGTGIAGLAGTRIRTKRKRDYLRFKVKRTPDLF